MRSDGQFYFFVDPPRETKTQRRIRRNAWFSGALLVGMIIWSYVVLIRTGRQVAPMAFGGIQYIMHTVNPGGGVFVLLEAGAWWLFFRRGGPEARGAAAFVGLFLLAALAVVVGSVAPGENPNLFVLLVLLYAIGSHLLYAIAGSSARLR